MAFNKYKMNIYIQVLIVKYYHPEFNELLIQKNLNGQIVNIKDKDK